MADQRGYDLMLCYASNTEYSQLQRQLANHKVDGVILTYAMADDPCIELLRQYETPFVLIGRSEDKTIPQADNDQVAAACEMTRILLQLGAKRIALLVGSTIYAVNTDRIRGYLRGFAEFGVPVDQRLVHSGVESAGQTLDALEAALEQKADCILCGDDEIAFEVRGSCGRGISSCPTICELASLYDSSMLASITPSVSAVQYDAEQLGKTACRMRWTGWPEKRSSCGSWKAIRSSCGILPSGGNAPTASNNALFVPAPFPERAFLLFAWQSLR